MSSSVHVGNKKKYILILGKCPTQGLGEHSSTAEKMYSVESKQLFICYLLIIKFKTKDAEIVANPL